MALFAKLHNLSHADGIFHGDSGYAPGISKWLRDGQPCTMPFRYDWDNIAPLATKSTGILRATLLTAGTPPLQGSWVSTDGKAYADVPRNISAALTTTLTAGSFLVTGNDYYGEVVSEKIGIPTSAGNQTVLGLKAFKSVTTLQLKNSIGDATAATTISVGFGNALGLPFAVAGAWDVLTAWADTTACTVNGTQIVKADTTSPATNKTGDVRGTFLPTTVPDGSKKFRIWFTAIGKDTRNHLYGLPPA